MKIKYKLFGVFEKWFWDVHYSALVSIVLHIESNF